MLFNSIEFLLFFPAVVLLYYAIPGKLRVFWILLTSYLFYMNWNPAYALLLLFSTAVTFLFGLLIGKRRTKEKAAAEAGRPIHQLSKVWVGVSFAVNLAILFFYKYFDFTVDNLNVIRGWMGLAPVTPGFDVLLPVGISFYIFQALSYVVDVYRGDVRMETNFIKYAAFVSFFPQLVAGPIERSTNLLTQFDTPHKLEYDNVRDGLLRMVWGFFLKIVIADRAAILVNQVFNYCNYYEGPTVLIAAVLFAFQVYGDFAGYSNIAIGAAQVMGFKLMKNFERPYLAVSVSDFWRRWHISLSTWFRDYLYIPLGGNRKGTVRKYINQMIVMLVSGLWHGAAWTFVLWGFLHGVGMIWDNLEHPHLPKKWMRQAATFAYVCMTFVFFRAESIAQGVDVLKSIVSLKWNGFVFQMASALDLTEFYMITKALSMKLPGLLSWFWLGIFVVLIAICFRVLSGEKVSGVVALQRQKGYGRLYPVLLAFLFTWSMISMTGVSEYLYFSF